MINARAETLTEKQSFRQAFKKKRCLIIAVSFYERKRHGDQSKTPMRIKLKSSSLFAIAGLWDRWISRKGESIYSCTVITTTPNELVKAIHDRMPVILHPSDEKLWLDPDITDEKLLKPLLHPFHHDLMETCEVSSLVKSPKNNSVGLIREIC